MEWSLAAAICCYVLFLWRRWSVLPDVIKPRDHPQKREPYKFERGHAAKAKHPQKMPAKSIRQQVYLIQQVRTGTMGTEDFPFLVDLPPNGIIKSRRHGRVPCLVGLAVNLAVPS